METRTRVNAWGRLGYTAFPTVLVYQGYSNQDTSVQWERTRGRSLPCNYGCEEHPILGSLPGWRAREVRVLRSLGQYATLGVLYYWLATVY